MPILAITPPLTTTTITWAIAQLLADAGVGVWRTGGLAYTASEAGIFYGPLLTQPDRAIGITVYAQTDDIVTGRKDRYVQVRYRGAKGAPNGADVLADAGFNALHGTYRTSGIARITRTSTAPLGADSNGRQERADNYQLILDNHLEASP
jgi:hypothetical protein